MRSKKPPPAGARVIILARFSSDLQNPLSAEDQVQRCRTECQQQGWNVVEVFKDEAKSGRSILKRHGYVAAMSAAISGKCDLIMVTALDRLGRNTRELNDARYRLGDHGVDIYIVDRGILSSFEFSLWAELAQIEAERIGERVGIGQRAAAGRGKIMGDAAYGYRLVETGEINPKTRKAIRRVEIDPVTSKVVLRIHEEYAAGLSPFAIAAALSVEGVPAPEGGTDWSATTILGVKRYRTGVLRNPIVIGLDIFGKTISTLDPRSGKTIRRAADEDSFIVTEQPDLAIVPKDLWDKNQERIQGRSIVALHRNRGADYLLSGKIFCSECNRPYNMVSARKLGCSGRKTHVCENRRRVDRVAVERVVLDGLRERLSHDDTIKLFIPEYLAETKRAVGESVDKRTHATQRLAEIEEEIAALLRQARAGAKGFAIDIINAELSRLGGEREGLARDLKSSSPSAPAPTSVSEVTARLRRLIDDLEVELAGPERDAQCAADLVRSLITKVMVTPIEPEGRRDGRGAGPVRITVSGGITRLVSAVLLDRRLLHVDSMEHTQESPIATYTFYRDILREVEAGSEGVLADAAVVARLLDDCVYPITDAAMTEAIAAEAAVPMTSSQAELERRCRMAISFLDRAGWLRRLRFGKIVAWVWRDREISEGEWSDRWTRSHELAQATMIARALPPEASVVLISSHSSTQP